AATGPAHGAPGAPFGFECTSSKTFLVRVPRRADLHDTDGRAGRRAARTRAHVRRQRNYRAHCAGREPETDVGASGRAGGIGRHSHWNAYLVAGTSDIPLTPQY